MNSAGYSQRYDLSKNFWLYFIIFLSIFAGIIGVSYHQEWIGIIIPSLITACYLVLFHSKLLFKFLFFLIPLSMEMEIPGGVSTDLFGEPVLWILFIYTLIIILKEGVPKIAFNSISFLLLLHLSWIMVTGILAVHPIISLKYWAAKLWYVIPFYLLPFYFIKDYDDVRQILKFFIAGLIAAALYFFIQHYFQDLSYMSRTNAGKPIWRNHVNYACTLVIGLPMIWYVWKTSRHPDRWVYWLLFGMVIFFIYFAYARIAYLCMITSIMYVFILRFKFSKLAILSSLLICAVAIVLLHKENQYVHLAPEYEKAVMQLDFERKISSTTTGEDISTMERLHRWVAGKNMIHQRPVTGFGPANFYRTYRPFTLFSFETYVSDNPDRSGIHNYYLMLWVEQGIPGLIIFLFIIFSAILKIEYDFHKTENNSSKILLIFTGLILIMILTINTINDMIEVIKIGGIFFFNLFLIGNIKMFDQQAMTEDKSGPNLTDCI